VTAATGDASTATIPSAPGVCNGQAGLDFFGVTASVVLGANQSLTISGTADLGAGVQPVGNLSLNLCYLGTTGSISALTDANNFGNVGSFLALPAGTFMPFTLTRSFTGLPPDTYLVGLCGCIDGVDAWVTDWSWINVQVAQL
jgi:hypothetical protein